jgi:hypothetical protein
MRQRAACGRPASNIRYCQPAYNVTIGMQGVGEDDGVSAEVQIAEPQWLRIRLVAQQLQQKLTGQVAALVTIG